MHLTESSQSEDARGTNGAGGGENDRTFQKTGEAIALENPSLVSGYSRKKRAGLWAQVQTCWRAPDGRGKWDSSASWPFKAARGRVRKCALGPPRSVSGPGPATRHAEPELGFGSWQPRGLAPARLLSVSLSLGDPPAARPPFGSAGASGDSRSPCFPLRLTASRAVRVLLFPPPLCPSVPLSLPFSLRLTCPLSSSWPWLSRPTSIVRPPLPSLGLVS